MFCSNCGKMLPDGAKFCAECGAKAEIQAVQQTDNQKTEQDFELDFFVNDAQTETADVQQPEPQHPETETQKPVQTLQDFELDFGEIIPSAPTSTPTSTPTPTPTPVSTYTSYESPAAQTDLPMKWYNFNVSFSLIAGAVINVINAIMTVCGVEYMINDYDPEFMYSFYDGLLPFNIFYGLLLIGLAVFGIYVRKNLADFKKDAPRLLVYFRIATSAVSLIYSIGSRMIVSSSASMGSNLLGAVIGLAILLYCETKYFNNRKHLFVN
mgnify:CR=1 FL=1